MKELLQRWENARGGRRVCEPYSHQNWLNEGRRYTINWVQKYILLYRMVGGEGDKRIVRNQIENQGNCCSETKLREIGWRIIHTNHNEAKFFTSLIKVSFLKYIEYKRIQVFPS